MSHRSAVAVLALVCGALVAPGPARAQVPAERASLDSIRASLDTVTDSLQLVRRARARIAVARTNRDDPFLHMELGYLAYHLAVLTGGKKHYEDAASEFQWTAELRPSWPYAWYWLGLAELASGESSVIVLENIRQMLGQDFLSRAVRSFVRAVEADPSFSQGLVDLATTAMRQRISPRLEVARAALRQATGTAAGRVPQVQLMRGRLERRMGEVDTALAAFRAYLAAGGDSTIGGVEVARCQAVLGRADSAMAWYLGAVARPMGDSARLEVRRDLRWIATPAELAEFDRTPPESLGVVLRHFWVGRDIVDGRRIGERMGEQFRRYHYAVRNFPLLTRRRGLDVTFAFRDTSQQDFDDRGIVYLRHGEPGARATFTGSGIAPNESWRYPRTPPATDLVLHFAASRGVADYHLVQSLADVCRAGYTADGLVVSAAAMAEQTLECLQSRADFGDPYDRLSRGVPSANTWADERLRSIDMVRAATTTDSYAHHFTADLHPVVSWFAMADEAMRPELHVVFAVPAARLHPVTADDGALVYPLALRLLVYDSASGRLVAALDTLRAFHAGQRLGAGTFVTEQMVLRVPAGRFAYAFVIQEEHASAGNAISRQSLEVQRMDGGFAASDMVLGREGSGLAWRRPEGDVPLNPLMRFPKDGTVALYYEVYGLPGGASVGTRVRVTPAGGRSIFRRVFGGRSGADLQFTTVTDAPGRTRIRQRLELRGLANGRYLLRLELTDPISGSRVVRESPFDIEG
jgi:tetratricopeptide (TPR) repeat protein